MTHVGTRRSAIPVGVGVAMALTGSACGRSGASPATYTATGVVLTWASGKYSACRTGGTQNPDCRSGSFQGSRIALPPGSWELTITVPDGCGHGAPGSGGTLATVPPHGDTHVAVSAAACAAPAPGTPTGAPTTASGGPPTTGPEAPQDAVPAGWTVSDTAEGLGSVYVVATAPARPPAPVGATSVVIRLPVNGSPATVSGPLPTVDRIAVAYGQLWATIGPSDGPPLAPEVAELDPDRLGVARQFTIDAPPGSLAVGPDHVWVGTSTGVVDRIDLPAGRIGARLSSVAGREVTSLSLSADRTRLYGVVNTPVGVYGWDTRTARAVAVAALDGIAGGQAEAAPGGVWIRNAIGTSDLVRGLGGQDLSTFAHLSGTDLGEEPERLEMGAVGNHLIVIGKTRGACVAATVGTIDASFELPGDRRWSVVGPDGAFTMGSHGLERVELPAACLP